MRSAGFLTLLGVVLSVAIPARASAQCDVAKLFAGDGERDDLFGAEVAVDGEFAAIAAVWDDELAYHSGAVYVFQHVGASWIEVAKLTASDGAMEDRFGTSIGISGDRIVVGAMSDGADEDSGAVYVFHFDGVQWVEEARLIPSDTAYQQSFGFGVDIDGDCVVVGAPGDNDTGPSAGAGYVFRLQGTNWVEEAKVLAGDGVAGDEFGSSVAISGESILIGARLAQVTHVYAGAAYVFRYRGSVWNQEAKLVASDPEYNAWFGECVDIDGNQAVVGAYVDGVNDHGAAYIFEREGRSWDAGVKLIASDGSSNDNFGIDVALSADTAVIGSWRDNVYISNQGSAYVFRREGGSWFEQGKLLAPDAEDGDRFGSAVSIQGRDILVGASHGSDTAEESGVAYVFEHLILLYGQGCAGSGGYHPRLSVTGCATPGGRISIEITRGLGGATAFLLLGDTAASVPLVGGCDLLLDPIIRFIIVGLSGDGIAAGQGTVSGTIGRGLAALGTVKMQAAVVDPGGANGFSMTNGVSMEIR